MGILIWTGELTQLNAEAQRLLSELGLDFLELGLRNTWRPVRGTLYCATLREDGRGIYRLLSLRAASAEAAIGGPGPSLLLLGRDQ